MGTTIECEVILGVRVQRTDLYWEAEANWECANGHKRSKKDRFCNECGTGVVSNPIMKAKDKFAAWCKEHGVKPEDGWEHLRYPNERWTGTGSDSIAVYPLTDSERPEKEIVYAIGYRVLLINAEVEFRDGWAETSSVHVAGLTKRLVAETGAMGLIHDDRIRLFLSLGTG